MTSKYEKKKKKKSFPTIINHSFYQQLYTKC